MVLKYKVCVLCLLGPPSEAFQVEQALVTTTTTTTRESHTVVNNNSDFHTKKTVHSYGCII